MTLERLVQVGETFRAIEQSELRVSRRGFLKMLAVGTSALVGCYSPKPTPTPRIVAPDISSFPEGAIVPGAKDRLIQEVNGLPESPIKRALVERVLPYYQNQTPFVLNRSGLEITVHSANITAKKTRKVQTDGTFVLQGENAPQEKIRVHAAETVKKIVPLPNLVKKNEISSVPKGALAPDNKTLLADFNLDTGAYVPSGVYPAISVITPYFDLLNPSDRAFHTSTEAFTFIKEACSLLFADIMLEEIHKKAKELGLPTTAKVKDTQGNIKDTEIITAYWMALFSFENQDRTGRTKAALDIAGYLIALKAIEGTNTIKELMKDSNFWPAIKLLPSIDLGTTPHDIWSKSLDLAITNTDIQILPHTGDINRAP